MRTLLLVLALAACGGERERPAPLEPNEGVLTATVTQPAANDSVNAGTTVAVTIAAQDPSLRSLVGLGLVARRIDLGALVTLDSATISFTAREASSAVFEYDVPAGLPVGAQINLYGIAFGSSGRAHESAPRTLFIEACDPADTACP